MSVRRGQRLGTKGRKERIASSKRCKDAKTQRGGAEGGFVGGHYEGHGRGVAVTGREACGVSGKCESGRLDQPVRSDGSMFGKNTYDFNETAGMRNEDTTVAEAKGNALFPVHRVPVDDGRDVVLRWLPQAAAPTGLPLRVTCSLGK